jgi:uncharacterized protein (TIGR00251 family)
VITGSSDGVYLDVQVQAKARRPGIRGVQGDRLKIAVSAPAEGGKANRAVTEAIADLFEVKTAAVSIVKGVTSPQKRIFIAGMDAEEARSRLST